MIQVESAQEVLVGLPVAGVLGDHDSGDNLEQFSPAQKRPRVEFIHPDDTLRWRGCGADEAGLAALHNESVQLLSCSLGKRRRGGFRDEGGKY